MFSSIFAEKKQKPLRSKKYFSQQNEPPAKLSFSGVEVFLLKLTKKNISFSKKKRIFLMKRKHIELN